MEWLDPLNERLFIESAALVERARALIHDHPDESPALTLAEGLLTLAASARTSVHENSEPLFKVVEAMRQAVAKPILPKTTIVQARYGKRYRKPGPPNGVSQRSHQAAHSGDG